MAAPVTSAVTTKGGGVQIVFRPPLEFIARQAGSFHRRLSDLDELWERFEPIMADIERDRFESEGHGEWPSLAQSTLDYKSRHGYPSKILERTGSLRDSLIDPAAASKRGRSQLEWGSGVDYAAYHQLGTPRMPKREVIGIRVEDRQRFEKAMVGWLDDIAARSFGRIAA